MKDTFTLADLANFKLEASATPAAPAEQPTESSAVEAVPSDETVETSAETTPAPTTETVESAPEAEPSEAPKEKYIPKGRFDEVIEERNALRRFNEYLLAKDQSPIATASASAPVQADTKPTLESSGFDTAKYEEAMTAWTKRQVESARTQGAQQAEIASDQAAFDERMAAYAKANPSVVTALGNPHLPKLAPGAAKEVVKSDLGPQILHHLAANPDQAVRIAKQTSEQQAAAIGRIEGELRAKKQKTPQITRAPTPPTPTQGRGNTPSVDPAKMSTKEWIQWDRQQEAERRQAKARRA